MNFAFLGFLADGQQSIFKYFLNGSSLFLGELENIITVKPESFSLSKWFFNFLVGFLSTYGTQVLSKSKIKQVIPLFFSFL